MTRHLLHPPEGVRAWLAVLVRPLLLLAACLLLSLAIVAGIGWQGWQLEQSLTQAQSAQARAKEQLQARQLALHQARADEAVWRDWVAGQMVGDLSPDLAQESLETLRLRHDVVSLQYRLGSAVAADSAFLPPPPPASPYGYRSRSVRLNLEVRHEEQALTLLQDWLGRESALRRIRRCVLSRQHTESEPEALVAEGAAPLKVECDLEWLWLQSVTLREPT